MQRPLCGAGGAVQERVGVQPGPGADEVDRVGVGRSGSRPDADDQEVVEKRSPLLQLEPAVRRVHGGQSSRSEAGADAREQRLQRELRRRLARERLLHEQRPVDEVRLGGEQLDGRPARSEVGQREGGLDPRHPAARDHHMGPVGMSSPLVLRHDSDARSPPVPGHPRAAAPFSVVAA